MDLACSGRFSQMLPDDQLRQEAVKGAIFHGLVSSERQAPCAGEGVGGMILLRLGISCWAPSPSFPNVHPFGHCDARLLNLPLPTTPRVYRLQYEVPPCLPHHTSHC